ncbi:MAG TPA: nucleotidyltransferase domain-containing protein [Tepidisphaeraceae bacterium]|jgi:predicted nucleotidyltransferase
MTAEIRSNLHEIASLCQKYSLKRLWLFGSATDAEHGRFDAESDYDFLIEIDRLAHPFHGWNDPVILLPGELGDLLGRRVDVLEWTDVKDDVLQAALLASRELVYENAGIEVTR